MIGLDCGNRRLLLPSLIPSTSSYETQLPPADALRLQTLLLEPVSLVSAFDIPESPELVQLCREYCQQGILFLDSGGYESSRIAKYAKTERSWSFEDYELVSKNVPYDFIFSFDLYPEQSEPTDLYIERLTDFIDTHRSFIDIQKLIPVVHSGPAKMQPGSTQYSAKQLGQISAEIANRFNIQIISVTERELGIGIKERASSVATIKSEIVESRSDCLLHVLGCGNPLSFSLLVKAGADICDGLEWCRTFAAPNLHLHHFQQQALFPPNFKFLTSRAQFVLDNVDDYYIRAATVNLTHFSNFVGAIHSAIADESLDHLIGTTFDIEQLAVA